MVNVFTIRKPQQTRVDCPRLMLYSDLVFYVVVFFFLSLSVICVLSHPSIFDTISTTNQTKSLFQIVDIYHVYVYQTFCSERKLSPTVRTPSRRKKSSGKNLFRKEKSSITTARKKRSINKNTQSVCKKKDF